MFYSIFEFYRNIEIFLHNGCVKIKIVFKRIFFHFLKLVWFDFKNIQIFIKNILVKIG